MTSLQIKHMPAEVHELLRERARSQGKSLSQYALSVLERDLTVPSTREWLQRLSSDAAVEGVPSEEIVSLIHEGRAERDEQILGALRDRD